MNDQHWSPSSLGYDRVPRILCITEPVQTIGLLVSCSLSCKHICMYHAHQHGRIHNSSHIVDLQASTPSSCSAINTSHKDARDNSSLPGAVPGKQHSRATSAAPSLPGLHPVQATSIRELYSEWCVSVRLHAQASALSAVPAALAQRASLSAKALTNSSAAATAFKGQKPTFKAVPGEEGLLEVSRDGTSMFGDRLWLDQLKLTRCCVVKVIHQPWLQSVGSRVCEAVHC